MNAEKQQLQIIVDQAKIRFMVGFGMNGEIDRRQGRPKRFKDPLLAYDFAEVLAKAHDVTARRYFPDEGRTVKVHGTPEFWAAIEAEKARLDAEKAVAQND